MKAIPSESHWIRFVSTFLSHSSADTHLAEEVATQLGRRGVLAWLDRDELAAGPLNAALRRAVQSHSTMTIFLSDAYLGSDWCQDELRWAFEDRDGFEDVLPVYLGDPLNLVRRHPLLGPRFLHPNGDRVNQLGFYDKNDPANPDPNAIADMISAAAYRHFIPKAWSEIAVILDQRGNGPRQGEPPLPPNVLSLAIPALTFRPNREPRQQRELLKGSDWEDASAKLTTALSNALGNVRGDPRSVRVLGNAQCGLVWAVGRHFNRTTSATLFGYGKDGLPISNSGQVHHTPLLDGDPERAQLRPGVPLAKQRTVALGVGPSSPYAEPVRRTVPSLPLFWIESGFISDSNQAMQLVKDLVASATRLHQKHGVEEVALFWTTANHLALLAAANLTPHVSPKIRFMERDHAADGYVELPMP